MECKADGFPKPQVTWKRAAGKYNIFAIVLSRNNEPLRALRLFHLIGDTPGDYTDLKLSNPDISVEDGTLSINNIQKTNEGYYLCEAVNGIGSGLSAVILISVQGISRLVILHFAVICIFRFIYLFAIFFQLLRNLKLN